MPTIMTRGLINCQGVSCRHDEDPDESNVDSQIDENVFYHSSVPSVTPTTTSTAQPQGASSSCVADENGSFGAADASETSRSSLLEYTYQVETKPNFNTSQVNTVILPAVEQRISSMLVPVLFQEACGGPSQRRYQQEQKWRQRILRQHQSQQQQQQRKRRLEVIGLTAKPSDQVIEDAACEGTLSDLSSQCYVVRGAATVYSEEELSEQRLQLMRDAIQAAMDNGQFNGANAGIVNIRYQEQLRAVNTEGETGALVNGDSNDNDNNSNDSLAAWTWAVILGACLLSVLVGVFVHRKHQRRGAFPKKTRILGIHPRTPEDSERPFDGSTRSSWDVWNLSAFKEDVVGITPRKLEHAILHPFSRNTPSSWDILRGADDATENSERIGISSRSLSSAFLDCLKCEPPPTITA